MVNRATVVTPWYPTAVHPFRGAFVEAQVQALEEAGLQVRVVHTDEWLLPAHVWAGRIARRAFTKLSPGAQVGSRSTSREVLAVPTPVSPSSTFAELSEAHADALRHPSLDHLFKGVVHAHTAVPAGWAALQRVRRSGGALFVTEHASYLHRIFAQPRARSQYAEVLRGCAMLFCVGERLREEVAREFPDYASKIRVVPNPVQFDAMPFRAVRPTTPDRWLYVGSFTPLKGVRYLVEAFAVARLSYPNLTLTLVGSGPDRAWVEGRIEELGMADSVTIMDPVSPFHIAPVYLAHDLLVHASRSETFGMTIVEAVSTGMPVLATRCGGPEETIGPIEEKVGRLVPVGDGVAELLSGFYDVLDRFDGLDMVAGREHLKGRFNSSQVARQLMACYKRLL